MYVRRGGRVRMAGSTIKYLGRFLEDVPEKPLNRLPPIGLNREPNTLPWKQIAFVTSVIVVGPNRSNR